MKLNDLKESMVTEDLEYSEQFASMILESNNDFQEVDGESLDKLLEEMLVEAKQDGEAQ